MFKLFKSSKTPTPAIELISIHIPKTGGTSFYNILKQVYGDNLSKSYKRRDYLAEVKEYSNFEQAISADIKVLHGHLYYHEIQKLREKHHSKVICWLRDPIERVLSNYLFFMAGLNDPTRNPKAYLINKHRINETFLEYAQREENRNRMSSFLKGIELSELFFCGFLDNFEADIQRLGQLLDWPTVKQSYLNKGDNTQKYSLLKDESIYQQVSMLNTEDVQLYESALELHKMNR